MSTTSAAQPGPCARHAVQSLRSAAGAVRIDQLPSERPFGAVQTVREALLCDPYQRALIVLQHHELLRFQVDALEIGLHSNTAIARLEQDALVAGVHAAAGARGGVDR
eukprot:CAMPEP_0119070646 /NCGR_PEP_ID=MMETSP1178-20130426/42860_1 /TAXON_ID=33656 /ORGANISM="unid sp, Strain CCMP2000" /LENGTH=107 /DNA_ID=CAMNT_0007052499 /DNA_START=222 /DNA_END=546 /DNA_ORIENTATION=-